MPRKNKDLASAMEVGGIRGSKVHAFHLFLEFGNH
jgi:hypothetical protein